jgi:hypothetical protein
MTLTPTGETRILARSFAELLLVITGLAAILNLAALLGVALYVIYLLASVPE